MSFQALGKAEVETKADDFAALLINTHTSLSESKIRT
jgi:hypothetical protein